jgi:hypothetical protein
MESVYTNRQYSNGREELSLPFDETITLGKEPSGVGGSGGSYTARGGQGGASLGVDLGAGEGFKPLGGGRFNEYIDGATTTPISKEVRAESDEKARGR